MLSFLYEIFNENYLPHGHCFLGDNLLIWIHIISDFIIALSYFSIPIFLVTFIKKRNNFIFHKIIILFAIFILACGSTHLFEIWNIWHGDYYISGILKIITAIASLSSAFILFKNYPTLVKLPNLREFVEINDRLSKEIEARKLAQNEVINLNVQLEKRIEVALEKKKMLVNHFSTLIESMPQLVWTTSADGNPDYVNKRWVDYTGITVEQMQGDNWANILHEEDRIKSINLWKQSILSGDSFDVEYRIKGIDGLYKWFLTRGFPLRDNLGQICKWVGTCTYIQDQKVSPEKLGDF